MKRKIILPVLIAIFVVFIFGASIILLISDYQIKVLKTNELASSFDNYKTQVNDIIKKMRENGRNLAIVGEIYQDLSAQNRNFELDILTETIKKSIVNLPYIIGSGIWYEPYKMGNEKYVGPYVYWDDYKLAETWEYSNAEYDYHTQDWYTIAIPEDWDRNVVRLDDLYITEPYSDMIGDKEVIFVSYSYLMYDKMKRIIGITTTDWSLEVINKILSDFDFLDKSEFILFDKETKKILYNKDQSKILKNINEYGWYKDLKYDRNKKSIQKIERLKIDGDYYDIYLSNLEENFTLIFLANREAAYKLIFLLRTGNVMLLLFILLLIWVFMDIIIGRTVKPLKSITDKLEDISKGEGDLTVHIDYNGKDEMGVLSGCFNMFVMKLHDIIQEIKAKITELNSISDNLAASSSESSSAIQQINANIMSMTGKTSNLDEYIHNLESVADDFKLFVENVNKQIHLQSDNIITSSAQIEQMVASINNANQTAEAKLKLIKQLEESAKDGRAEMDETLSQISEISNGANIILETLNVINSIASQTDLLAMNAAIEAAHAGESGKGFSVVADEIRKLAENTTTNAKDITNSLKHIIELIEKSQQTATGTGEKFDIIMSEIIDTSQGIHEISGAMNEIEDGSKRIIQSLTVINDGSAELKNASETMKNKVDDINKYTKNISMISTDTKNGMSEITIGTKEINESMHIVSEASIKNAENIKKIQEQIEAFKT